MPVTKDVIAHILKHVNAEASVADDTQTPGMVGRAQYVRDAVDGIKVDNRDLSMDAILAEMVAVAPVGTDQTAYRAACATERGRPIANQKPWLAIHGWVSKEQERP